MSRGQDAAGVIIMNEQKQVLLVRQTYGKKLWNIPGGMVEDGESAWDAAIRELKEEVDISVQDIELSGMYFQPHRNRYVFVFKAYSFEGAVKVDQVEIDHYGFFDIDELPRPIHEYVVERLEDAVTQSKSVFKQQEQSNYQILD